MGYLFTGNTKQELVEELIDGDTQIVTHKHSLRGNHLWAIQEAKQTNHTFIIVFLLEGDVEGWGYKEVTESMGPMAVDCPLNFLKMVPCPDSTYARDWRVRVRAAATRKNQRQSMIKQARVGDTVVLENGYSPATVELVSTKPMIGGDGRGNRFRILPRMIERIEASGRSCSSNSPVVF